LPRWSRASGMLDSAVVCAAAQGPNIVGGVVMLVFIVIHSPLCYYIGRRIANDFEEDDRKFDRFVQRATMTVVACADGTAPS
jgi:hypothetical protein